MQSIFRFLEKQRVRYLLISGQACVLYGASQFTEDIDLWGRLPVASPEDLVLLKRTNRPSDYEAISKLVRLRVEESPRDARVLRWALRHTFDVDDLIDFAGTSAERRISGLDRPSVRPLMSFSGKGSVPSSLRARVARLLAVEAAAVQEKGRRYWLPILRELKRFHAERSLVDPGTPVASLL